MMTLEALKNYGIQIDSFSYRGIEVGFYEDALGHQITAIWENKLFQFGVYNTSYRDDMKLIIDDYLDTVTRFEDYPELYGSKLAYFQNSGFRDLRLSYRGRILKVYLLAGNPDLEKLKKEAYLTLLQYKSENTLV
jgi:hypothetical protein